LNWIRRNFWEIHRSASLAVLGGLIAIGQLVTYFFWSRILTLSGPAVEPLLCWSFQNHCGPSLLSGSTLNVLLWVQVALSLLAMVLFFLRRSTGIAWFGIFFGFALHFSIYLQDASLRSNPNAFFFLLSFVFLFIPNKVTTARYLFFCFFILEAMTKLNADWLSGLGFEDKLNLPAKGLEWVSAFSVLIQVVMPFFLMCRDSQRLGYGFAALFIYQMVQFTILRDAGHLILGLLLLFFVFRYFEDKRHEIESMYQSYEHPEPSNFWWPVLAGLFIAAQFVPRHLLPQLEVLKLEKIQTAEECEALVFSYSDEKVAWIGSNLSQSLPGQLKCNPQANFNSFKQYCTQQKTEASFKNLTVFFLTRGMSESNYRVRFGSDRFCDSSYTASRIGGLSQ
jgi:hypothetical protein